MFLQKFDYNFAPVRNSKNKDKNNNSNNDINFNLIFMQRIIISFELLWVLIALSYL
jgi:hypothetical protein